MDSKRLDVGTLFMFFNFILDIRLLFCFNMMVSIEFIFTSMFYILIINLFKVFITFFIEL